MAGSAFRPLLCDFGFERCTFAQRGYDSIRGIATVGFAAI